MMPNDGIAPTIAVLLACLATAGQAGDWTTTNHVASTRAIKTSDGGGGTTRSSVPARARGATAPRGARCCPGRDHRQTPGVVRRRTGEGRLGTRSAAPRAPGSQHVLVAVRQHTRLSARTRHRLDLRAAEEELDLVPAGEAPRPARARHEVRARRIAKCHRSSVPRRGPTATVRTVSARFVDVERPRAQLRGVHLNEAEAVDARNARAGGRTLAGVSRAARDGREDSPRGIPASVEIFSSRRWQGPRRTRRRSRPEPESSRIRPQGTDPRP